MHILLLALAVGASNSTLGGNVTTLKGWPPLEAVGKVESTDPPSTLNTTTSVTASATATTPPPASVLPKPLPPSTPSGEACSRLEGCKFYSKGCDCALCEDEYRWEAGGTCTSLAAAPPSNSDDDGVAWWVWLLIAVGVLCVCLVVAVAAYMTTRTKAEGKPVVQEDVIEAELVPLADAGRAQTDASAGSDLKEAGSAPATTAHKEQLLRASHSGSTHEGINKSHLSKSHLSAPPSVVYISGPPSVATPIAVLPVKTKDGEVIDARSLPLPATAQPQPLNESARDMSKVSYTGTAIHNTPSVAPSHASMTTCVVDLPSMPNGSPPSNPPSRTAARSYRSVPTITGPPSARPLRSRTADEVPAVTVDPASEPPTAHNMASSVSAAQSTLPGLPSVAAASAPPQGVQGSQSRRSRAQPVSRPVSQPAVSQVPSAHPSRVPLPASNPPSQVPSQYHSMASPAQGPSVPYPSAALAPASQVPAAAASQARPPALMSSKAPSDEDIMTASAGASTFTGSPSRMVSRAGLGSPGSPSRMQSLAGPMSYGSRPAVAYPSDGPRRSTVPHLHPSRPSVPTDMPSHPFYTPPSPFASTPQVSVPQEHLP